MLTAAADRTGSDLTLLTLDTVPGREALAALTAAGVDAVSLANDQVMRDDPAGLIAQLDAAKSTQLGVFGAGLDAAAAYRPWRTRVRGVDVAVIGLNQVEDAADRWSARPDRPGIASALDQRPALAAVRAARASSDLVIVMPHWGNPATTCLTLAQRDFAAELSTAGADIVVGTGAIQAQDTVGATFVAYGTTVLTMTVQGRTVISRTPSPGLDPCRPGSSTADPLPE
jgi:poly-gamma-glutamate synthesis protein (capsule biosynthesis protein)